MWKNFPSFSKRKQVAAADGPVCEPTELELTVLRTSPAPDVELKGRQQRPQEDLRPLRNLQDHSSPQQAAASLASAGDTSAQLAIADGSACMDGSCSACICSRDGELAIDEPPAPPTPLRDAAAVVAWPADNAEPEQTGQAEQQAQQPLFEGSADARLAVSILLAQLPMQLCLQEQLQQSSGCGVLLSQYCDAVIIW